MGLAGCNIYNSKLLNKRFKDNKTLNITKLKYLLLSKIILYYNIYKLFFDEFYCLKILLYNINIWNIWCE